MNLLELGKMWENNFENTKKELGCVNECVLPM